MTQPVIAPKNVLIIRHAEKPASGPDLSIVGYERAAKLVSFFQQRYPNIAYLFATAPSADSNRSVETVTPLSVALQKPVDQSFANDQFAQLAVLILGNSKYRGADILICWHHEKIPELANALKANDVPSNWPDDVFDRVWQLTYEGGLAKLTNLPQDLLTGDSTE